MKSLSFLPANIEAFGLFRWIMASAAVIAILAGLWAGLNYVVTSAITSAMVKPGEKSDQQGVMIAQRGVMIEDIKNNLNILLDRISNETVNGPLKKRGFLKKDRTALASGDLKANTAVPMTWDGTAWEAATIGNAPTGGGATASPTAKQCPTIAAAGYGGWKSMESAPKDKPIELLETYGISPWYGLFKWSKADFWEQLDKFHHAVTVGPCLFWRPYRETGKPYIDPTGGFQNTVAYECTYMHLAYDVKRDRCVR
jgi:hypothetical protein